MINTNTVKYNPYNRGVQSSRLDNITFKSSSFSPVRPENFNLSVDGKDASLTPVTSYLNGIVASFFGSKGNKTSASSSKHISYLA